MSRLRITHVNLRLLFPTDDPLAAPIARLVVLREDFILEMQGLIAEAIGSLDGAGSYLRTMYFWRNSLRTLVEIRDTFNTLSKVAAFREGLST